MKRNLASKPHAEAGMTLVEVLASIVILTIILSIVFMVFIQTAKTTRTTEATIDATYIGQTEMEKVYAASRQTPFNSWEPAEAFLPQAPENDWDIYERQPTTEKPFRVKLQLKQEDNEMVRVLIQVYEEDERNDEKPIVQMENLYQWVGGSS